MDVQHAELLVADDAKAVHDAGRRSDVRAWPEPEGLVPDQELGLAFEDVERVGLVVVRVRVDALEVRPEPELRMRWFLGPRASFSPPPGPTAIPSMRGF
jgi:hypothetical protein